MILPTDGRQPIVISDSKTSATHGWIPEFRPVENSWGESMAQALIDAGMERARIGVSGIRRGFYTHGRAFHGVVNHSSYAEVAPAACPTPTFENGTEAIGYARYVKSAEQIACLRRGAAIAAAGIDKMIELARPGMDEGLSLHSGDAADDLARQRILSDGVLQRASTAAGACRALKIPCRRSHAASRCTASPTKSTRSSAV